MMMMMMMMMMRKIEQGTQTMERRSAGVRGEEVHGGETAGNRRGRGEARRKTRAGIAAGGTPWKPSPVSVSVSVSVFFFFFFFLLLPSSFFFLLLLQARGLLY
jgi:hypothetical protein